VNKIKNSTANIYLLPGLFLLILAGAGSVIPVLPTVPFILAASWCLAKSSPALQERMKESRFYKATESLIARSVIAAAAIIKVIFFICIKTRK
jgi:hypothetical protein